MSRKTLFLSVTVILAGFLLGSGARYILAVTCTSADGWCNPTVAPTGGNIDAPINVGDTVQTKTGGLKLGRDLEVTGMAAIGKDVSVGGLGIQSWKFAVQQGSLLLGSVQTWGADGTVLIGPVPTSAPPSGVKLNVNGSIRIQGGGAGQGKVLTSASDGTASWETPVAPVTKIIAGLNIVVNPDTGLGAVTVSAIAPSMPSLPGWLYPGSGSSNRVPVADGSGNVSWRTVRAEVSGGGISSFNAVSAYNDIRGSGDPDAPYGGSRSVYDDGTTKNRLCQLKGYERYVSSLAGSWDSPKDNGVVAWNGSKWVAYDGDSKAPLSRWGDSLTCSSSPSARIVID